MAVPATAVDAASADVMRCRRLAEPAARLACYDAIPIAARPTEPVAENAPAAAGFGRPSPAAAVAAIESNVADDFDGWRPNSRIRLTNGQVWQVTDDSSASLERRRRKVTVRRGALGTYFLDFEDSNHSPRVRRID